jgi:hypothetical protein
MQLQVLRWQAGVGAAMLDQFIGEIESQIDWTTRLPWSAETIEPRRFDELRVLRQVPSIIALLQLDATGKERRCVSQDNLSLTCDRVSADFSPKFTEAVAKKVYYGPVYLHQAEPYMMLSVAGIGRDAGVSVAEVSLKLLWEFVAQVGEKNNAYVIDAQGRLIAHTELSLVLRNTDMTRLTQVRAARAAAAGETQEPVYQAEDIQGRKVLTAYAPVAKLGWLVFVELPVEELYPLVT